jgi:hypothetical protein
VKKRAFLAVFGYGGKKFEVAFGNIIKDQATLLGFEVGPDQDVPLTALDTKSQIMGMKKFINNPDNLTAELLEHLRAGDMEHRVVKFQELQDSMFDSKQALTVIVDEATPVCVRLTGLICIARQHAATNIVFESSLPVNTNHIFAKPSLIKANADYIFVKPSDNAELLAWAWPDPSTLDSAKDVWKQLVQFHCWHVLDTRSDKVYWYPPTSAAAAEPAPVQSYWAAFCALLGWK